MHQPALALHLLSLPILGLTASNTKSAVLLVVWAGLNALGCLWLATLNLDERER
ncbi:MAG: hypothetical protein MUF54_11405 [Polyangiaceae bacterium]|nr:hypothetical protein [Polyangiaceae bacterium]